MLHDEYNSALATHWASCSHNNFNELQDYEIFHEGELFNSIDILLCCTLACHCRGQFNWSKVARLAITQCSPAELCRAAAQSVPVHGTLGGPWGRGAALKLLGLGLRSQAGAQRPAFSICTLRRTGRWSSKAGAAELRYVNYGPVSLTELSPIIRSASQEKTRQPLYRSAFAPAHGALVASRWKLTPLS